MAPRIGIRQKKLNHRTALNVLRERELDLHDNDQGNVSTIDTGVEKHEETEHHLQAAIASQAAIGKAAQVYIPTPETVSSTLPYQQLYQAKFSKPATLIRFSSTVEDCCGVAYNITDEDDVFLKDYNEKLSRARGGPGPCSEDNFEMVMNFFEETTKAQQPFSNVGEPPPILTFEEMEGFFDESIELPARVYAKDVYEHWKSLRTKSFNTAIQPGLKLKIMESATDADDNDPYVCFRRREVRQIRKTRGRDAQSAEKLRKLRLELEAARNLIALVTARENSKKDNLAQERKLFEQRTNLRKLKRGFEEPYKNGDEDLLVNQRPPKKRPMLDLSSQRNALAQRQGIQRPDGRPSHEPDLVLLEDLLSRKDGMVAQEILNKKAQHLKWNTDFVDFTNEPLTPPPSATENTGFRVATTEYLPTPPASHSEEEGEDHSMKDAPVEIRYGDIGDTSSQHHQSFRRRYGRGGRLWIDRRSMPLRIRTNLDPRVAEQYKFDDDDDDDMKDYGIYYADPYELNNMRYRAAVCANAPAHTMSRGKPPLEQSVSNGSNSGQGSNPPGAGGWWWWWWIEVVAFVQL